MERKKEQAKVLSQEMLAKRHGSRCRNKYIKAWFIVRRMKVFMM